MVSREKEKKRAFHGENNYPARLRRKMRKRRTGAAVTTMRADLGQQQEQPRFVLIVYSPLVPRSRPS